MRHLIKRKLAPRAKKLFASKNKATRLFTAILIASVPICVLTANLTLPLLAEKTDLLPRMALAASSLSLISPLSFFNEAKNSDMPSVSFEDKALKAINEDAEDVVTMPDADDTDIPYEPEENEGEIKSADALVSADSSLQAVKPPIVKPKNAGAIVKKLYEPAQTTASININNAFLKNCTSLSSAEILNITKQKPKFKIKADGSPEVLLMHTHATESYQENNGEWFDKSYNCRTTDNTRNTIRVGNEIKAQLEAVGIGVLHDETLHDYPSYNGAYERSAQTVKRILKENPTIKVVLDIHRDAIQPDSETMIAPTAQIKEKSCAQVMIIAGCDNGKLNMPNYKENLKLAAALQRQMTQVYDGLARPILFDYRKYNQDLTTGSLLLEMGGHANTLEEAIYCGELVGKSLADTLLELQ